MIKDFIYTLFGWKRYYIISYVFKNNGITGNGRTIRQTRGKLGKIVSIERKLAEEFNFGLAAINGIFEIREDQAIYFI